MPLLLGKQQPRYKARRFRKAKPLRQVSLRPAGQPGVGLGLPRRSSVFPGIWRGGGYLAIAAVGKPFTFLGLEPLVSPPDNGHDKNRTCNRANSSCDRCDRW